MHNIVFLSRGLLRFLIPSIAIPFHLLHVIFGLVHMHGAHQRTTYLLHERMVQIYIHKFERRTTELFIHFEFSMHDKWDYFAAAQLPLALAFEIGILIFFLSFSFRCHNGWALWCADVVIKCGASNIFYHEIYYSLSVMVAWVLGPWKNPGSMESSKLEWKGSTMYNGDFCSRIFSLIKWKI